MALNQPMMDMHAHTTASDGQLSPRELVKLAKEVGLSGVAITDHDTVAGVQEAFEAGAELGIRILPGIEISTVAEGHDIHVLGYFTNNDDSVWRSRIEELSSTRNNRNELLINKLNELGIAITLDEVLAVVTDETSSVGRPHFAQVLIEKGYVQSKNEAFDRYLGEHGSAFVQPLRIHPTEAFRWIREAGGVCVLAHPGIYEQKELVEELLAQKPDGVEVYHSDHTESDIVWLLQLAEQHDLIVTGGSDFHGFYENGSSFHGTLGSVRRPLSTMDKLFEIHQKRI